MIGSRIGSRTSYHFSLFMYLKKLELSGFKSFAKTTVLEFPHRITAIVGPNGSGKSNIVESIRWVLGEQSMKALRSKKGDELIWNGSEKVSRMGKASVTLLFDNKDESGKFAADDKTPFEFEEISIMRKIFRDGLNEYYLNNSQVRLKDVILLVARMGLGEAKHNIIGQGEVDRILMSTPRERREMLEEALGLRVYQLKKNEAVRKLEATAENMKQVEALIHEISPHLRFLKSQAAKAEAREKVEGELKELQKIYFAKEKKEIEEERQKIEVLASPIQKKRAEIGQEIASLLKEIESAEMSLAKKSGESEEQRAFLKLEARRRELERELGRLEGKLEVEKERISQPKIRVVDLRYIREEISEFLEEIKNVLEIEEQAEAMRTRITVLIEDLESLLSQIERGTVEEKRDNADLSLIRDLEDSIKKTQAELSNLSVEIEKYETIRKEKETNQQKIQAKIRGLDQELRAKQDEEKDLALQFERIKFEEEKLTLRRVRFERDFDEAGMSEEDISGVLADGYDALPAEELYRKIERLKVKLEEIGRIDPLVIKEYQETETRHSFLTKELDDLKKASDSLKELIGELDEHIKNDFQEGFSKIKEEFHNYFRIIFGGGRASLNLMDVPVRGLRSMEEETGETLEDESEEKGAVETGIEIIVDLPKKHIKGLAMLSGGERALTSIALLFAITAVNPPPFLVLDETDAALDEANSQRYAAILKELAKKTQLILITHNRETMKAAGILYGVTMGDDGVSKLLSLKFDEAEVYANR